VLDQVGVDVTRVMEPTPGAPGAEVTRLQGGTTTELSINQGQVQQLLQGAQQVETEVMEGYRRLHELRELEEQLRPMSEVARQVGVTEQIQSTTQLAGQLDQQRRAVEGQLERFWNELEAASSGAPGMRAGIDVSRVQAEGQATRQMLAQNRIEPLRESVQAHQQMLSVTERLVINCAQMAEALRMRNYQGVENLKAEQESLFRSAASVIGAREVMEHVRVAWTQSRLSTRNFYNLARRIGAQAALNEERTQAGVAAGRRIGAQLLTQQILEGTNPGHVWTPVGTGTRVGAGALAALEVLRIILEIMQREHEMSQAAAIETTNQRLRGRNMVQWWKDRGVRPFLGVLDENDHRIDQNEQRALITQAQIWAALDGTAPANLPDNSRIVVMYVDVEDRKRAVAQLNVACTTLNDWYRLVDDGARNREQHAWTPFSKVPDGRWLTLEFDVNANEYRGSYNLEVHQSLERLHGRLTANQTSDLNIRNLGANIETVRDSAWWLGEDRVVWTYTSPGMLGPINFGTARPRFVRTTDPVVGDRQGMILVRAADAATYVRLRGTYWITSEQYIGSGGTGHYFRPNEEAKAYVDPAELRPAR
jgi:hypothetical protein